MIRGMIRGYDSDKSNLTPLHKSAPLKKGKTHLRKILHMIKKTIQISIKARVNRNPIKKMLQAEKKAKIYQIKIRIFQLNGQILET